MTTTKNKKDKQQSTKKTKDRAKQTPLKIGVNSGVPKG
jgi:hypothetical protein